MSTPMDSYGPYDSGAGANITEAFWRLMTRWFASNAVAAGYLNELNPFGDSTGLQAKVDTGGAVIRGAYGESTSVKALGLAAVGGIAGGSERWDRLIVRNDFVSNQMVLDVLTGAAGASPNSSRPALTQTSSMWEMLLADVGPLVNTTTTVTAGMVIDGRWKMREDGILFQERGPLSASAATIQFGQAGGFPSDKRLLRCYYQVRGDNAADQALVAQFNGDTGGNYEGETAQWTNNAASVLSGAAAQNNLRVGAVTGSGDPAGNADSGEFSIHNYSGTTFRKGVRATGGRMTSDAAAGATTELEFQQWQNTAALLSMLLFPAAGSFIAGSWFKLEVR